MPAPTMGYVKSLLFQIAVAMFAEELAAKLGRRLQHGHGDRAGGPVDAKRRPVRRLAGAMLAEAAAEGAAEIYWQRRRMTAAADRMVMAAEARQHGPAITPLTTHGA